LNPLVSSSKNLKSPALDAGSGAPFFLLLMINWRMDILHKNVILVIHIWIIYRNGLWVK
jgi:hypothetical protein